MCFLFAEVVEPAAIAVFFVLTVALLGVAYAILWKARNYETKLILLGLLVAVVAVGYGTLLADGAEMGQSLMRIGVILVLGGLGVSLLSYLNGPPADLGMKPAPAAEAAPVAEAPVTTPSIVDVPETPHPADLPEEPRHEA